MAANSSAPAAAALVAPAFVPPRMPTCSPFSARDAVPSGASGFAPLSRHWRDAQLTHAVPGVILALAALVSGAACISIVIAARRRVARKSVVRAPTSARTVLRVTAALLALGAAAAATYGSVVTAQTAEGALDAWWEAASEGQAAAAAALGDADAAAASARAVEYGLRALSAAAPALSQADGGAALAADAAAAADSARDAADAGGAAAASVRTKGTDRVAALRASAEPKSRRVTRAAAAGGLAATLGVVAVAALAAGVASAVDARVWVTATAAAAAFTAAALVLAVGVGGGDVALYASRDACLYGESAATRVADARGGPTAARAAAFYLNAALPANSSALVALRLDPTSLRSLLGDPKAEAALAYVRSRGGAAAIARAGLPRDDRRRLLALPDAADALKARLTTLDASASPTAFEPAILGAKRVPCCAAPTAAHAFRVAAAIAGTLALATAAVACILAATAPPRGRGGKSDGREGRVVEVVARGSSL